MGDDTPRVGSSLLSVFSMLWTDQLNSKGISQFKTTFYRYSRITLSPDNLLVGHISPMCVIWSELGTAQSRLVHVLFPIDTGKVEIENSCLLIIIIIILLSLFSSNAEMKKMGQNDPVRVFEAILRELESDKKMWPIAELFEGSVRKVHKCSALCDLGMNKPSKLTMIELYCPRK